MGQVNTRVQHKHDIEENWNTATDFIPLLGELIIYDIDDTHKEIRLKEGDGVTKINSLPFVLDPNTKPNIYTGVEEPQNAPIGSMWIDTSEVAIIQAEEVSF